VRDYRAQIYNAMGREVVNDVVSMKIQTTVTVEMTLETIHPTDPKLTEYRTFENHQNGAFMVSRNSTGDRRIYNHQLNVCENKVEKYQGKGSGGTIEGVNRIEIRCMLYVPRRGGHFVAQHPDFVNAKNRASSGRATRTTRNAFGTHA
jgi:hypothetical protein